MRDAVRVALLARPGAGADRLRDALRAAGADLVLEADPTTLEPATLAGARPGSVVVLLDAAVEEALDRLDAVLHDPAIDVLYEEAAVAASREGWDAARWSRHLSAKLMRHGDVLPPGREPDDTSVAAPVHAVPFPPAHVPAPELELDPAPEPRFEMSLDLPEPPGGPMDEADHAGAHAPSAAPMFDPVAAEYEFSADAAPDPVPAPPVAGGDAIRDFRRDLADIEQRIASMGLVADEPVATQAVDADASADRLDAVAGLPETQESTGPGAATSGVVLVFAGIGGPDAVRQFLGALPDAFPRPVLIHQRLDGGRHDRLVQQMARATTLPVQLGVEGGVPAPGHVYVVPPGLRVGEGDGGLRFAAGDDPMEALPAGESAVLMFSGSDTAMVDAAMRHADAGALVAGQSPEDCYDAAAADALVARGAQSGPPAELAQRLADRWAS